MLNTAPSVTSSPLYLVWEKLRLRTAALAWVVIAVLGAVEGIYGRSRYVGDWIAYLNVNRAVSDLDWRAIFDPMWSPGYPSLIALFRVVFPATAEGEWYAILLLNWLIYLAEYATWRYLLRQVFSLLNPSLNPGLNPGSNSGLARANAPAMELLSGCIFLSFGLGFDHVSRVSPDLMVTTFFLLAAGLTLRIVNQAAARDRVGRASDNGRIPDLVLGLMLGSVLGAGYWVKGIFLSLAAIFLLMLGLICISRRTSWRPWVAATVAFYVLAIPFIAAISWSYGQFTLGASGALNYAFHVNHVPHWTHWQGGDEFGSPIHATRQLMADLPVFEFATPFRSTYPPYENMAYWYRGYRSYFSFRSEAGAIVRCLFALQRVLRTNPILYAIAIALLAACTRRDWRMSLRNGWKSLWPIWAPAMLGIAIYMLVHVESRYLTPFFMILSLFPLIPFAESGFKAKGALAVVILLVYSLGAVSELAVSDDETIRAAIHREDFRNDPQWKLAGALKSLGLNAGDPIAVVDDGHPTYLCSWAYVSRLRIVAEFGALPWRLAPWDRTVLDHDSGEQADENYRHIFWSLPLEKRALVIQAFRNTGARAIIALAGPYASGELTPGPGWSPVGEYGAWIYRFE